MLQRRFHGMIRIGVPLFALAAVLATGAWSLGGPHVPHGTGTAAVVDTTLADTVAAGSVLIRLLPASVAGETVSEYRGVTVPVRGWLYERSFFWRVPSDARASHTFLFAAVRPSSVDTVRLRVTVTPPEL